MIRLKNIITLVLGVVLITGGGLMPATGHAKDLKFSTPTPPPHIFTKSANKLAGMLKDQSGGKFTTKVHPLNKLGNVPAVISLLRSGAIEFAIVPAGDLARQEESFYSWFLPYAFEDVAAAGKAAQSASATQILEKLESQGLVGLAYIFPGQRHVLSTFPIQSTEDMKNKKVRAFPNEIFEMWWKEVGAAPTALPLPEIAPSLVTGVIDAVDVDLDIVVGLKFHKNAPYLALTNHMSFPGVLLASKKWWDGLSDADRTLVRTQIADVQAWAIAEQTRAESTNLDKLKADGVSVTVLDEAKFKQVGETVRENFLKRDPLIQKFYNETGN